MRNVYLIMLAALTVCMAACSGKGNGDGNSEKKDAITLKTEVQELGNFTDFASFADEMKIKLADAQTTANEDAEKDSTVNLIMLASLDVKSAIRSNVSFRFEYSIVDEDYATIVKLGRFGFKDKYDYNAETDQDGLRYYVYLEKGTTRNEINISLSAQEWGKVLEKGAFIIIKPAVNYAKYKAYTENANSSSDYDSSSTADDDNNFSSNESDSEDWDSILDSYENYVDKYISLAKKAASGDASAMSEYAELAEEAQELSSKLSNAKSDLSSSQLSRYTKITQKMANAAQQMR